jgi:hypothetical protein
MRVFLQGHGYGVVADGLVAGQVAALNINLLGYCIVNDGLYVVSTNTFSS